MSDACLVVAWRVLVWREREWDSWRDSVLAVVASGNDHFLKSGRTGSSEVVLAAAVAAAKHVCARTDRGLMVGMFPKRFLIPLELAN